MTLLRTAAALAAMLASGCLMAQSEPAPRNKAIVYKCVNSDGSVVYSESACSADPTKVQTIDTTGALRAGSGGHQDEIAQSVADSDCRSKAFESTRGGMDAKIAESNAHIADYRKRQEELQAQAGYIAEAELRRQADELDAAIARESEYQQKETSNVELAYQQALIACDQKGVDTPPPPARTTPPPPAEIPPAEPIVEPPPPANDGGNPEQ